MIEAASRDQRSEGRPQERVDLGGRPHVGAEPGQHLTHGSDPKAEMNERRLHLLTDREQRPRGRAAVWPAINMPE